MDIFCTHIRLVNYKSHEDSTFLFDKKINCIIGNNGVGKTNLLDAVYYSCMAKSYFVHAEQWVLRAGADFFKLQARFFGDNQQKEVVLQWSPSGKKDLYINQVRQDRISELVGKFPVVFFSPNDSILIYGGSEERRKFMDSTLCQIDKSYLEDLMKYNKILAQRNAQLKFMAEDSTPNTMLLEIYDAELSTLAHTIYTKRKQWIKDFSVYFETFYHSISNSKESVSIFYTSELEERSMMEWFSMLRATELISGRTSKGIHHDDLIFEIKEMSLKRSGSQGQQKTFLLALKLAQYALLKEKRNRLPIFLFDDIFDKFDAGRMERIFTLLQKEGMGQIFMSDTDKARILPFLERNFNHYTIIEIGKV